MSGTDAVIAYAILYEFLIYIIFFSNEAKPISKCFMPFGWIGQKILKMMMMIKMQTSKGWRMINNFEQKALNNTVDLSIFDKHLFL